MKELRNERIKKLRIKKLRIKALCNPFLLRAEGPV